MLSSVYIIAFLLSSVNSNILQQYITQQYLRVVLGFRRTGKLAVLRDRSSVTA